MGLRKRLRNTIFSHPALLARFPQATKTPKFLAAMMKISTKTNWPQVAISRVTMPSQTGPATKPKEVVGLYVDCYTSGFDREVLDSALALLELWEFEVLQLPGDTHCCGAAAFAGGNLKTAQKLAKSTYSSIVASLPNISALVTLNATCDGTIRDEWPKYWGIEVSTPVMPFTDFAIERAPASFWQDLNGRDSPNDETTTWVHTTCRSKVARGDAPLLSLAALGHLPNVRELDLACCGAAGSFAFKEEHQEVAHGMGENILSQIHANGREQIVVDSGTCAIHLAQISGIPAKHPAYWLYERYLEIGVSNGCD